MALSISSVCRNITPSATLRLNALAAEKRKQGQDIISLAAGEPDFPTPAHISQAGKAAIDAGRTVYTATAGIPELRAAVARHYQEQGVNYQTAQVIVTTGAKQAASRSSSIQRPLRDISRMPLRSRRLCRTGRRH